MTTTTRTPQLTTTNEFGSVLSRGLNVILGGSADLTFSARVHVDGWRRWEMAIDILFLVLIGETDHCARWWQAEVHRSRENIRRAEALIPPQ